MVYAAYGVSPQNQSPPVLRIVGDNQIEPLPAYKGGGWHYPVTVWGAGGAPGQPKDLPHIGMGIQHGAHQSRPRSGHAAYEY